MEVVFDPDWKRSELEEVIESYFHKLSFVLPKYQYQPKFTKINHNQPSLSFNQAVICRAWAVSLFL